MHPARCLTLLSLAAACAMPAWSQTRSAKPAAAPAASASAAAPADSGNTDHADLETTQIIGNRELPKVLYIVPWKRPVPTSLSGKPPGSVLDEALAPLDRDVFRREVAYGANAPDAKAAAKPDATK
ncbi:hypothetical protein LRH25_10240 [Ideonella azotifigens]|uniref:Uncharacterized protein n=1 Tax=Ideonella azotifigens TaxID=513160 RepID=A0ABN1KEH6_9BURK|nr:hypothetical protein [Ideonella azotifigens]MCD2340723.1 hypothetical protein [Ideonella azotifigens]